MINHVRRSIANYVRERGIKNGISVPKSLLIHGCVKFRFGYESVRMTRVEVYTLCEQKGGR